MSTPSAGSNGRPTARQSAGKQPVARQSVADPSKAWWRDAVIYQVYPRSFADSDGDGMGDLGGVREHLGDLEALGVDAVWLSPFFPSPQADAGYDVADYRDVDPLFGTLDDFDALLAGAHQRGLRVVIDLVPNHTSSKHVWFTAALAAAPGSRERNRYVFRDGRGEHGELSPNNWPSQFGGPAWTRVDDGTANPQWYLHLFDAGQPDLNWDNPEVIDEFQDILRFWLNRGVDGFRVDVAHGLVKQQGLPDVASGEHDALSRLDDPRWDQPGVHDIYRGWHRVLEGFGGDRMLVAEAWVADATRRALYVRPDEMQQAFSFGYLMAGWDAGAVRHAIDDALGANDAVGATTTWVLSNHDVVRHASRLGYPVPASDQGAPAPSWTNGIGPDDPKPDDELGLSRARAATLGMLALPGSAYLYQGEELGLSEVTDLAPEVRQDPEFLRTAGAVIGRDGARVPLPWDSGAPAFGFSPSGRSWLPQPASFADYAANEQRGHPGSTLEMYRAAIDLRRTHRLGTGRMHWNEADPGVLDFTNGEVRVVVNMSRSPQPLGDHVLGDQASGDQATRDQALLHESSPGSVIDGQLQPDRCVWLLVG